MMTTRWKLAAYALLSFGAVVLIAALLFLSFPDFFVNTFLKGRIIDAFQVAYPAYAIRIGDMHYNIGENRIGFDSVALTSRDSSLSCTIAAYSASGTDWLELLWARGFAPDGFTSAVLDAQQIVVNFPKASYELRCEQLRVSVPDSEMVVEALTLHPSGDDDQFFAMSKFRKARFRLVVPHVRITGMAGLEVLQGMMYSPCTAEIRDVFMDVLINKEKPVARDTSRPPMPHEILALLEQIIAVDSVNIRNGSLKYGERFAFDADPGLIMMDSMQISVRRTASHGTAGDTATIFAKGQFMKSAGMTLLVSIPVSSPEFSFHYSGSLGWMDLRVLNSFVEAADRVRIRAGILQSATFKINVASGHASGQVRAVYKDLTLAAINRRTGSDKGFFDKIGSFMANSFVIRGTNMPDSSGWLKIGDVQYTQQRDDPFFTFAWFALRSGLEDVVGF